MYSNREVSMKQNQTIDTDCEQPMDEPHREGSAHPELHPDYFFDPVRGVWQYYLDPDNWQAGEACS
jgi:hypothetical protein